MVEEAVQNFPTKLGSVKKSKSIELIPPECGHLPFCDYVATRGDGLGDEQLWEDFVAHERYGLVISNCGNLTECVMQSSYVWHAARPRWGQGTVEYRAVCQQPHNEPSVAAALSLGWAEKGPEVWQLISSLSGSEEATWAYLGSWWRSAIELGLAGKGKGPRDGELLRELLMLCEQGLLERGLGEEKFLEPVWGRLEIGANPGQMAQKVFLEHGAAELLKHAAGH